MPDEIARRHKNVTRLNEFEHFAGEFRKFRRNIREISPGAFAGRFRRAFRREARGISSHLGDFVGSAGRRLAARVEAGRPAVARWPASRPGFGQLRQSTPASQPTLQQPARKQPARHPARENLEPSRQSPHCHFIGARPLRKTWLAKAPDEKKSENLAGRQVAVPPCSIKHRWRCQWRQAAAR